MHLKLEFSNQFKTKEDIFEFVEKNSKYIKLIEDQNGELSCVPQEWDNAERYIMNINKMYIVNEKAVKEINGEYYSSNLSNFDKLAAVEEVHELNLLTMTKERISLSSSIEDFSSNNITNFEDLPMMKIEEISKESISNGTKLLVWIQTEDFHVFPSETWREVEYTIKNQRKTLGIWFNVEKTTSYFIDLMSADKCVDPVSHPSGTLFLGLNRSLTSVKVKSNNEWVRMLVGLGSWSFHEPYFTKVHIDASNTDGSRIYYQK